MFNRYNFRIDNTYFDLVFMSDAVSDDADMIAFLLGDGQ